MNFTVIFDWKSMVALGGSFVAILLVLKFDSTMAKEVSIHAVDACKECAVAVNSTR